MLNPSKSRSCAGFTLIEMILALIMLAVIVAVMFPMLSRMSKSGARDSVRTAATGEARATAQLLESDLRGMRAPLRPTGDGEDAINVISSLNGGSVPLPLPAASWPDIPTATLWGQQTNHDLLFAGPNYLMFWADVMDNPAGAFQTELVRWYLASGATATNGCPSSKTWCLVREVRYATSNDASTSSALREVLATGRGALPISRACFPGVGISVNPQANPRAFCYQSAAPNAYAWNSWSSSSCSSAWTGIDPDPNSFGVSSPVAMSIMPSMASARGVSVNAAGIFVDHEAGGPLQNVQIHPLDRITTIAAVLPGGSVSNNAADVRLANAEVAIPSRSSREYRTAILCGDR